MSTALTTIPNQLPAHLAARSREGNLAAMGGIKAGGFARITIPGGKFFLVNEGEKTLITDPQRPDLPTAQIEVVVVGFNPNLNKILYLGKYQAGDDGEPDCSSDDGVTPDAHILNKQAANCATCPQNAWGSKINEQGKQIKACSDNKRLVVLRSDDLGGLAMGLTITPASLKPWAEFVRLLDSKGIPVTAISIKVQFDPTVSFPKLIFKFDRFLTEEELNYVEQRSTTDEVRLIAMPRKSTPAPVAAATSASAPVSTQKAVDEALASVGASAPAAPVPPKQPPVVPNIPAPTAPVVQVPVASVSIPVQSPIVYSWEEGLPPAIIPAVNAVGGPDSEPGRAIIHQFKPDFGIKAEPPKEVDPYEGLPPYVKPAVDAAGGLGTPGGEAVFAAMTGKMVDTLPVATPEVKKTRTRSKKEEPVGRIEGAPVYAANPAGTALVSQGAVAAPVAQGYVPPTPPAHIPQGYVPPAPVVQQTAQPSMVSGPVVGAGGLGDDLEKLLANVMTAGQ